MATSSVEITCLDLATHTLQQGFADQANALIDAVFPIGKRTHMADLLISHGNLARQVDAARPDPETEIAPTPESILLFSQLLTNMSQSLKDKDGLIKWALKALDAVKLLVGDSAMTELQKLYPAETNAITANIDALALLALIKSHWETIHGSGSTFTVLFNLFFDPNAPATSVPAYTNYALALQKIINQCTYSEYDQLPLSVLFSNFGTIDRGVQGEVDKSYKYVNSGGL